MTAITTPDFAIDLNNVEKTYKGKVRALRGVAMRVHRGEIFGLLGPNGAGKSTLVKILMTIVRPSKCDGELLGEPVGRKSALARVGYLPEHLRFPDYLNGEQTLDYMAALAKVPAKERKKRADEMLELVGMTEWRKKKIGSYSKGMKQRLGIAQSLMNDPDLVLLDEPTDGVDPVGRRDIRNVMVEMKERGKSVLINSHLLGEVEMVCDRLSILVQGQVARQGTLDELTDGGRRYEIEIEPVAKDEHPPPKLLEGVATLALPERDPRALVTPPTERSGARVAVWRGQLTSGEAAEFDGHTLRVTTTDPKPVQPVIDALRNRGVTIRTVRAVRPSLEDLFIEAVTDPTTGQAKRIGASRKRKQEGE